MTLISNVFFFVISPTDGQLRHMKTGELFVFNAREDLHRWNQKRYEALGEVTHLSFDSHTFYCFCFIKSPSGHPSSAAASATGSMRIFLPVFSRSFCPDLDEMLLYFIGVRLV